MAKKSSVEKNNRRQKLADRYAEKRSKLRAESCDPSLPVEERYLAMAKLSELPRNSARIRVRLRCGLTGRPRGNYRKFGLSRIAVRELGAEGMIPGLMKASW